MFLHSRASQSDLFTQVKSQGMPFSGVVHSFDGTIAEAMDFIELGLYIGLNGCSLRTEENIATIQQLPLTNLLLETDAPWCEIKKSHASYGYLQGEGDPRKPVKEAKHLVGSGETRVKNRNEPGMIHLVATVVARAREEKVTLVEAQVLENTRKLFFKGSESV